MNIRIKKLELTKVAEIEKNYVYWRDQEYYGWILEDEEIDIYGDFRAGVVDIEKDHITICDHVDFYPQKYGSGEKFREPLPDEEQYWHACDEIANSYIPNTCLLENIEYEII